MPTDADGNRADIVMDAASVISRMNIGKLYEHYFSGAARDITKVIRNQVNLGDKTTLGKIQSLSDVLFNNVYNYLLEFYNIVSPKQYLFYKDSITIDEKYEHLLTVINDGIYLYMPIENEIDIVEAIKTIEKNYKLTYGPVSYVGNSGNTVVTKDPIRIAPVYMMLLEKIADDWASVSTGKLQHFGILTQITKAEKFSQPYRDSPVRTIGETEGRIFVGYCGREAIAEMFDKSNNPATQRNLIYNILDADKPTDIKEVVDRNFVTLGGNKPTQLLQHMFSVNGFQMAYVPEEK